MRKVLALILLSLTCAQLAAAPLRIGVERTDNPISFVDAAGQPTGFTAELLTEMRKAGFGDVEVVAKGWTQLLADFNAGKLDVLANVALTDERLQDMDFSISHAHVHGLVYSRTDRPRIRTTADFVGKKISTVTSSITHINALVHHGWGATIKSFPTSQEALDAVLSGDCDAVLLIYGMEGKYAKYLTDKKGLRREFVDDIIHYFRFAVHKGDTATLLRINDALDTVRHNGAFDRIYDKWIGPIEPHPIRLTDLKPHARSIIIGILVIIAIIWWQRHMLARVSRQARALRESEERFHGLVDSAFEGWVIHQDTRIILANANFAATFGYTVPELLSKSMLDLGPPESQQAAQNAVAAQRTTPYELIGLRKDGTVIPIEIAGQPCTYDGRPARIAAVRDLTGRKQAAADQLVLSKLESTGILAGGIAHDFNNLLAMLVLNIDMALVSQKSSDEVTRYLQAAKNAAHSAKTLTQQLITFAQGEISVRQPTDLAALLNKTVPLSLSGSNVRAEITVALNLWHVEVDAGQIERVIGNLVLNARESMPAGGVINLNADNVVLHAHEIAALPPGEYARLTITDRGYGIPAETISKIFDPYFSTKRRGTQKGMGLGLTISHSILGQHGGTLTVDSRVGAGTTFHVYLPATHQLAAPFAPAPAVQVQRSGRILVMDDEAVLCETVCKALEHVGYTVTTAAEGQTAIDHYRQAQADGTPFDVVLLDLTVRGAMGGLEAMNALLALDPKVKAIVMSGYAQEVILQDYARHGFSAALAKPFELDKLVAAIVRVRG
jgi:PAS domain S-box-containing protein